MIAYRVMDSSMYVLPFSAFFIVMLIWTALRLIKALSIIFDVRPAKMYSISVLIALVILVAVYFGVYGGQDLPAYARFLYHAATRTV